MNNLHSDTYLVHFKNLQNLVQGQQNILYCSNIRLCFNGRESRKMLSMVYMKQRLPFHEPRSLLVF